MPPRGKGGATSPTPKKALTNEDKAMMGYYFFGEPFKDKTPADYAMNPETGCFRPTPSSTGGKGEAPWGIQIVSLEEGITGATLPSQLVWENGIWISEIDVMDEPISGVSPAHEYRTWLVSGNGTPGRYWFRAYVLSKRRAEEFQIPRHPLLWTKKEKEGPSKQLFGTNWVVASPWKAQIPGEKTLELFCDHMELLSNGKIQGDYWAKVKKDSPPKTSYVGLGYTAYDSKQRVAAAPVVAKAPPLPSGIRFRCPSCGHWFKEGDLSGHGKVCPGADGSGYSDWIIMCDKECGCEVLFGSELGLKTLDHVSQCKPGFPRPKKEVKKKMEEEIKEESATPDNVETAQEAKTTEPTSEGETQESEKEVIKEA